MKYLIVLVLACGSFLSAQAEEISSNNQIIKVARVVELHNLVKRPRIQANVAVEDLGGNLEAMPTQKAHLSLYSKGELASTDASFELANIFKLISAVRIGPGRYEVTVKKYSEDSKKIENRVLEINATKAIDDMIAVQCDDFDCDDSSNFSTTIEVFERAVSE